MQEHKKEQIANAIRSHKKSPDCYVFLYFVFLFAE